MATIVAVRSGNWSDTSHVTGPWPGETTPTAKPAVGDTVQSDAYVVTIDEDVHVELLEATSRDGYFAITSAPTLPARRTIQANLSMSGERQAHVLVIANASGAVDITGNITGGSYEDASCVYCNGGNIGDITGNVTGGSGINAYGVHNNAGTIGDITGDVTGGSGGSAIVIDNGTIGNITGDITSGDRGSSYGVYSNFGTIGDITGNVTATVDDSVGIVNTGTIGDITGNITGGSGGNAYGIYNNTGTIGDITGNITGGSGGNAYGVHNNAGTIGDITGDVTGGSGNNAFGLLTTEQCIDIDGVLACGPTGVVPVGGAMRLVASAANAMSFLSTVGATLTLSNDYPAEADVKDGVDYNRGTMTGELAAGGTIGPVSIVIGGGGIRIS